ncbi:MAG TPA: hypothetical protein VH082_07270 [Rudaea sp.]|nr:hypothetical protein [Rudaea sp.]
MQSELSFRDLADTAAAPAMLPPSADLWSRIAAAHLARRQRRTMRRVAGAGTAAVVLVAIAAFGVHAMREPGVDWQARAQALELQLSEAIAQRSAPLSSDTQEELARVDFALQSAYDRGADKSELAPLWKQRSELLSVLLAARQQKLALTRI